MAEIKDRKLDPIRKLEIVTIEDEFGAQMILQHPLTLDGYDPDKEEADAIALMDANAAKYKLRSQRVK